MATASTSTIQAALENADRRKDEFLAMLAHELRNPLAPIVNALAILRLLNQHEPRQARALELIERQTTHLTRLVDELLEVSRITIGKVSLHKEVVEIGSVLTQALENARPLMESRKHQLEVILPDEPMQVEGDPMRLTQVLLNLLNNAAKYTPERWENPSAGGARRTQIVLRVRDNGYGIAPQLLPHIFDLFTQGERTLDSAQGGLGIGLTITRRLVEMHGGTISASSPGVGEGSEFVVRLPRFEAHHEADSAPPIAVPELDARRRILVVDDNVTTAPIPWRICWGCAVSRLPSPATVMRRLSWRAVSNPR
jgi:signal transduction histidine kinase